MTKREATTATAATVPVGGILVHGNGEPAARVTVSPDGVTILVEDRRRPGAYIVVAISREEMDRVRFEMDDLCDACGGPNEPAVPDADGADADADDDAPVPVSDDDSLVVCERCGASGTTETFADFSFRGPCGEVHDRWMCPRCELAVLTEAMDHLP